jgi:hypothetical protein
MPTRFIMRAFGFAEKDVFFSARLWRYWATSGLMHRGKQHL